MDHYVTDYRSASADVIAAASQRLTPRSLTSPGPAFRLNEIQVAIALVIGLRLLARDWTLIAERPAVLTDSSWLTGWMPIAPTSAVLVAVQIAGMTGVAAVVSRRYPASGFAVAVICYTLLAAWWGSSGKIMHNELLTVTVALVVLIAATPRRSSSQESSVAAGWPPRAALIVLATVYFVTGAQKLRHSGIDWVFSDNMSWVLRQGVAPRAHEIGTWIADHGWTAQLLAGAALLLELGAPVLLAFRATRIPFAAGVTIMHTSIWFMLGLDYSAWMLTAAAVAVPMAMPADKRVLDVVRLRLGIAQQPGSRTGRRGARPC